MAKIGKESNPSESSRLGVGSLYGLSDPESPINYVYFIDVCGFVFEFYSVEQITEAKDWFEQKVHKSTRMKDEPFLKAERDVLQRWHERLPASIKKGSKRERVVKALGEAIEQFS